MKTISINTFNSQNFVADYTNPNKSVSKLRVRAYSRDISKADKTKAFIGSTIGTAIPMLIMMKKQGVKNPLKLKYGMWEMIGVSAASIAGGVGAGMIAESKSVQKKQT